MNLKGIITIFKKRDKEIVYSYIKITIVNLIVLISIFAILNSSIGNIIFKFILNIVAAVMAGLVVAISFSILDRLGILMPIERDIKSLIDMSSQQQETVKIASAEISGYSKYRDARHRFGFNAILGEIDRDHSEKPVIDQRKMDDLIIDIFNSRSEGSKIYFMNSYLSPDFDYYAAIKSAVKRGVEVRMMLMLPKASKPAVIARFTDQKNSNAPFDNIKEFIEYIRPHYQRFDGLRYELEKENMTENFDGSFEIRYYSISLNFPLILIKDTNSTSDSFDVAYTGFYAGRSSEQMPYIEWRGGDFRIISYFSKLFEGKWDECADATYFFSKNAPAIPYGDGV